MSQPNKRNADMSIHADAIHSIAEQYSLDENDVRGIYESELNKLIEGTRITAFLPVLCVRHVKELIVKARNS